MTALAVAVTALAVTTVVLLQQQREQRRELSRLADCVSVLERNQGRPADEPIMGCPIIN